MKEWSLAPNDERMSQAPTMKVGTPNAWNSECSKAPTMKAPTMKAPSSDDESSNDESSKLRMLRITNSTTHYQLNYPLMTARLLSWSLTILSTKSHRTANTIFIYVLFLFFLFFCSISSCVRSSSMSSWFSLSHPLYNSSHLVLGCNRR